METGDSPSAARIVLLGEGEMDDRKTVFLRLPAKLVDKLDALAEHQSSSRNEFIKSILFEYIKEKEAWFGDS